jgi:hypothetical protein
MPYFFFVAVDDAGFVAGSFAASPAGTSFATLCGLIVPFAWAKL